MKVGQIVNYKVNKQKTYKGIITEILEKEDDFHGCVEVWLYSTTAYGVNNCEHFTIDYFKEKVSIIESKKDRKNIGKLVDTQYGIGLIVKEENEIFEVFLHDQTKEDFYLDEDNMEFEDYDIDFDAIDGYEDPLFYKDDRFNKDTYCIKLKSNDFKII